MKSADLSDSIKEQLKAFYPDLEKLHNAVSSYLAEAAPSIDLVLDRAATGDKQAINLLRDVEQGATLRLATALEGEMDRERQVAIAAISGTIRGAVAVLAA